MHKRTVRYFSLLNQNRIYEKKESGTGSRIWVRKEADLKESKPTKEGVENTASLEREEGMPPGLKKPSVSDGFLFIGPPF